jgi:hypothetical protein
LALLSREALGRRLPQSQLAVARASSPRS